MKKLNYIVLFIFSMSFFNSEINAQTIITVDGSTTTLAMASAQLSNYSGEDVIIEIEPGTYQDTVSFRNNEITSLTIQPVSDNVIIDITTSVAQDKNYAFKFYTIDDVTVRGLSFVNEDLTYGGLILIDGDGTGTKNKNIIFENCNFLGNQSVTSGDPDMALIKFTGYSAVDGFVISACNFTGGSIGILAEMPIITSNINVNITDNYFNGFGYAAIETSRINNLEVQGNEFISPYNTSEIHAVFIHETNPGLLINRNMFILESDISNTAIHIDSSNETANSALIINNMISIQGNGNNCGISVFNYAANIYYNNFNIIGGSAASSAISINKDDDSWFSDMIYNNVIKTNFAGYALYFQNINNDLSSNNNLYDVTGMFGNYQGTDCSTLALWQVESSDQDLQSIEGVQPGYVSFNDLHVNNYEAIVGLGFLVTADGSEVYDFDYQLRGFTPDIGADQVAVLVPGTISSDTTWSGLVIVNESIIIENDVTLSINPGTKIVFNNTDSILCHGNIMALGTEEEPIGFYTTAGTWKGITFDNSTNSNFECVGFANGAGYQGGVIEVLSGNITFRYCIFENNYSMLDGGAVFNENASVYFQGCKFLMNYAGVNGGAIFTSTGNTSVDNSLFAGNSSPHSGGDIYIQNMVNTSVITNCTFGGSYASNKGRSIFSETSTVHIKNSIIAGEQDSLVYRVPDDGGYLMVHNTDIEGGGDNLINADDTLLIFNIDPMFVDDAEGDFHLIPMSSVIDLGDSNYIQEPYDIEGNPRIYGAYPDLGAYEFQGLEIFADAGVDTIICSTSYQLQANNPDIFEGTWSVFQGTGSFDDVHDFNATVSGLGKTDNFLVWTVSDGFETVSDTVIVTNFKPVANAGADISLVSDNYPVLISNCEIELQFFEIGFESAQISTPGFSFTQIGSYSYQINGLQHGEQVLTYTLTSLSNPSCYDVDQVIISSGFSFYPSSKQRGLQWDDPSAWNVGILPQEGDSVSIFGTDMHINDIDAHCTNLVVTTGGSLVLDGTGKAPTNVYANRIYVEQDAEKFPIVDTAKLIITNGVIHIDSASGSIDDGFIVGSLGDVLIEPSTGGVADVVLGKNRSFRVLASAVNKNSRGNAKVVLRNGGRIYVEQDAEKELVRGSSRIVHVGSGGRIYVEQDAEKGVGSSINVFGGRIYVEQDAEKGVGGTIHLRGGRIYVEQDAEKNTDSSYYSLNIGLGGQVILAADASSDSSIVDVDRIHIYNGQLKVGSQNKNRAGQNHVYANRIYVEQDAEKDFATDTALIVGLNSSINIASNNDYQGILFQAAQTAVHVFEGGAINTLNNSVYIMDKGASFIDKNQVSSVMGIQNIPMIADSILLFSTPFNSYSANNMLQGVKMYWDESLEEFVDMAGADFNAGQGYLFYNTGDSYIEHLFGNFNTGTIETTVLASNSGVNLLGNPYPSAIDFDLINVNNLIQPAFYIYDFGTHNFKVHHTNSLSFTDLGSVLVPNQAFFVLTTSEVTFDFTNQSRVHFYKPQIAKTPGNYLVFSVFDGISTDELGLVFDDAADVSWNLYEDVVELSAVEQEGNSFYSLSSENIQLAINTQQMPNSSTLIPLRYVSGNTGNVTISLSENNLAGYSELYLYDVDTEMFNDLTNDPNYTFSYDNAGTTKHMYLTFLPHFTDIDRIEDENIVKIYSYDNKIYVSSQDENIQTVEIYNITGIKLYNQGFNSQKAIIQADVQPGIYIVKAICGNNIYTSKVIME